MSAPARRSVEMFYDVVSPYAWIGFEVMHRYATRWNVDLQLKPFFLGGVMQGSGNKAPAVVPNKGAYMYKDIARLRQYYQIPLEYPSNPAEVMFIKGTIKAMRYLTAVNMQHPHLTEAVSRAFWMRIWNRDLDITEPESLVEAGKAGGLDETAAKEALEKISTDTVKNKLKMVTQEALDHQAFGAPTFLVEDDKGEKQLVFGSDRFHIMAQILGEKYEGPLAELAKSKI